MINKNRKTSWIHSFFGMPHSRLGRWAIVLSIAFFIFFGLWLLYVETIKIERPMFFSDPLHVVLILSATASAISGGIIGILAAFLKCDWSLLILASIAIGGFVLFWTIAEIIGH